MIDRDWLASLVASKPLVLKVLLGLLLVTSALQLLSVHTVIHQTHTRHGVGHGFVSALRAAFQDPLPPPPDFNTTIDGDLVSDYECVGWRNTGECSREYPGERALHFELPCDANVTKDMAGYCEFQLKTAPETRRRVLPIHCNSLRQNVDLRCADVPRLLTYGQRSIEYVHDSRTSIAANQQHLLEENEIQDPMAVVFDRGIVYAVYEPGLLSLYASIRSLRALGCTLPIELWYHPAETDVHHTIFQELLAIDGVYRRVMTDARASRFYAKLYAVFYSAFDNVLLLDTDNFAVKDPTYLFETPVYRSTGAMFWPDYWRPNQTIFHIHEHNLVWPLFGLSFVEMFEQESGQVLINRRRHGEALNMLMYYGFTLPRVHEELRLLWGDKDLFRFAWMKTKSSFHYIQRPPGSAGRLNLRTRLFCGLTMVQHDPDGEILFLHRNTIKFSANPVSRQIQWTHLQQFRPDAPMDLYDIVRSYDVFTDIPKCWGKPRHFARSHTLTPIHDFAFRDLEKQLIQYVDEGMVLIQVWMRANPDHNIRLPPEIPLEHAEEKEGSR